MAVQNDERSSPWRKLFEEVRQAVAGRRDEQGVRGSINWLRNQMELRGANPNVVRNIIYRDKGRIGDKRVLYQILANLWEESGRGRLHFPDVEVLLAGTGDAENELIRLLGREKRQVFRDFVAGVRSEATPKLLITGKAGSGKTLLMDYIQEALELPPEAPARVVRAEFGAGTLDAGLATLASAVGASPDAIETRLLRIAASGAFAVQADAQADVARVILDAVRAAERPLALMLHVSRSAAHVEHLGGVQLRLNSPEVPRVNAAEWLWLTLFAPLSRLPNLSLLLSMADLPVRAAGLLSGFEEPVRLSPPSLGEARRFVRARLPALDVKSQEALVRRAGRSFEELRTLTLLTELRALEPGGEGGEGGEERTQHLSRLAQLARTAGDQRLRDFLTAVAVLSLPEQPTFTLDALRAVRSMGGEESEVELAFLDPLPAEPQRYRPFSRKFVGELRRIVREQEGERFREYNLRAAAYWRDGEATRDEAANRYLVHLFEARDWEALGEWLTRAGEPLYLLPQLWSAAVQELEPGPGLERIAHRVARHFVRLGAYDHPQALSAFEILTDSSDERLRIWALLQQAEGAVLRGQIERAEGLLQGCPADAPGPLAAERRLVEASLARWRTRLDDAAGLVADVERLRCENVAGEPAPGVAVAEKAAVWSGVIAKDRGDLEDALARLESVRSADSLVEARVAFQRGDVLLALGRFDASLEALDSAVRLADENHALRAEQSRYLSRRGTLRRMRGEHEAARADFLTAREVASTSDGHLEGLEREFWLARSEDEYALLLLAEGDFEEALALLERNIATFVDYARQLGVDPSYRVFRGTLRLARGYLFRALGRPYRLPLGPIILPGDEDRDLQQARSLVARVGDGLAQSDRNLRYWSLARDTHHLASVAAGDTDSGYDHALAALRLAKSPYQAAQSQAYLAAARLRAGDARGACEHIEDGRRLLDGLRGDGERGDLALLAWLSALWQQTQIVSGDAESAAHELTRLLSDGMLAPFHAPLLRAFGEALEEYRPRWQGDTRTLLAELLGHDPRWEEGRIRLPDALLGWWKGQGGLRAERGGD